MNMEDYCSDEVSILLGQKGFKEPCTGLNKISFDDSRKPVLKITHQKAMKWLRKYHNIAIIPNVTEGDNGYYWGATVFDLGRPWEVIEHISVLSPVDDEYKEVIDMALKYSLENLVHMDSIN